MAAKNWHRYGTKLLYCHRMYKLEGKYSLESTDPRESDIPPDAALTGGPGRGPAGRRPGRGLHASPSASLCEKHLLIYDVHMYQCIDIHWRFFL